MYGLIGKITARPGQREALVNILLEGSADMPGCLSYIVSNDSEHDEVIWVTEIWESKEHHQASLSLPPVKEAMSRGRPLIAAFDEQIELNPVGGHGLASPATP
ncbi:Quinol monooxygenase YgiN [Fodinibius sediminis]|uniref:Quinol monooxygenase YgiN n=2 Tax=Fodinibius sediminis TaxID=1214077 RepID=A0A521E605_9BACT|nr:Quinol monooxygenase YgiN [Fodinibius sediminis]